MHQGKEDATTVFQVLLSISWLRAKGTPGDSISAFSSINTCKDAQRSGNLMVAGFTKAKVWKVPQYPLEEAGELRMKSRAEHSHGSKFIQSIARTKTLPGLMVKAYACHSKAET